MQDRLLVVGAMSTAVKVKVVLRAEVVVASGRKGTAAG